jgi:cytochrome c oxidase cbb3-type subunit 3
VLAQNKTSALVDPISEVQQHSRPAAGNTNHESGRAIYNFYCYFCHGYSGNAQTLAATYLNPKPRNFTATAPDTLSREKMIDAVTNGRSGTAMKSFNHALTAEDIEAVVDFVRREFMVNKAENTRYHTIENGWPNHERYKPAFPFALGEIALDTPWETLSKQQQLGKRVFLESCVTCHDRAKVNDEGAVWELKAVSYPRNQYSHKESDLSETVDATSQASPYAKHDQAPVFEDLSLSEKQGETLFQRNCAFCHAADGTGKNWIGSFLDSHPRNLTDADFMKTMTRAQLKNVIREGLSGTTMSAWKHVLKDDEIDSIIDYINRVFYPGVDNNTNN